MINYVVEYFIKHVEDYKLIKVKLVLNEWLF